MLQRKKNLVMPVALIGGAVFYPWMDYVTFLSPYLIFAMLFITYCRLTPKEIKPGKMDITLLIIQIVLSALFYFPLSLLNHTVAEGVFICIFIPTATAAPVITSMLGGKIKNVVTYALVSNLMIAIAGPVVLALIGDHSEYSFGYSFVLILSEVAPLLLVPLLSAFALKYAWPTLHERVASHQQLSFFIWAISLFIVVGGCVSFAIKTWTPESTPIMLALAAGSGIACLVQFRIGRKVGRKFGDIVSGGQALMQKNTVLAVWLALAYMNPVASIGPACYILWQNIVNSWQIARHNSLQMKIS